MSSTPAFLTSTPSAPTATIASPASTSAPASSAAAEAPAEPPATPAATSFADMRLRVGDFLPIEMRGVSNRGASIQVLGWLEGITLMVTLPRDRAGLVTLDVGEAVTVRAFTGKSAFAFRTSVTRIAYQPFGYMHLRFPDSIDAVVIRRSFRHRIQLPATVTEGGREPVAATILNIGTTGALIGLRDALPEPPGTLGLRAQLELHDVPVTLDLKAAVRSTTQSATELGTVYQYGVEFSDLTANDRLVLGSLLWYEMHERPADAV